MSDERIKAAKIMLKDPDTTALSVAKAFGVSKTTLYRNVGKVKPDRSPGVK